jgi:copper chaperone CopZ
MKYDNSLRPEGPWEVRRKINLPSLMHEADGMAVERVVGEIPGVLNVATDVEKQWVIVRYNARQLNYQNIVETLEKTGFPPRDNWWNRFKGNWYRFSDENARANAKAPPSACCNKPPQ